MESPYLYHMCFPKTPQTPNKECVTLDCGVQHRSGYGPQTRVVFKYLSRVYAAYPQMSQIYADIEGRSIRMAAEIWDTIW